MHRMQRGPEKRHVVLVRSGVYASELKCLLTTSGMCDCKLVEQSLVDVMFCAQAGLSPSIPFALILLSSTAANYIRDVKQRLQQAAKVFPFLHGLILFPSKFPPPVFAQLQMLHFDKELSNKIQLVPVSTVDAAAHFMLSVRSKALYSFQEKAEYYFTRIDLQLYFQVESKENAKRILQSNIPFIKDEECEILLDMYGSIAALSRISEEDLLDTTILDAHVIKSIVELFRPVAL
ncbi:hypothetical protein AeNC1_010332 [Aphanomyces euteiches]|nr:hypothetical protein AeNC1_010332 [Aphanomyces euteiches]